MRELMGQKLSHVKVDHDFQSPVCRTIALFHLPPCGCMFDGVLSGFPQFSTKLWAGMSESKVVPLKC